MVNNRCNCLIVFGSYVPNGARHAVFSGLPGRWQKGRILATQGEHPDDIGPGETDVVEAWMLEFSDCNAELFTAEYARQEVMLFDRWAALDAEMGSCWVRTQQRWWPEDVAPVQHPSDMKVVNIYLPLARFPNLANQPDAVAPTDRYDFEKLWRQVKSGEKRYEWCDLAYLFSAVTPARVQDFFGDLPAGDRFIVRLSELFEAANLSPDVAFGDQLNSRRTTQILPADAIKIVRRHLKQQADVLRARGLDNEAAMLASVPIVQGSGYAENHDCTKEFDTWQQSFDLLRGEKACGDHWFYCLKEACGCLTRHNFVPLWLMRDWIDAPVDLEPIKELFLARYWFQIDGHTCHVFQVR